MSWFFIALLAQFVLGTSAVFDKLLLKKSFSNPVGYTFWLGILGLFGLVLIPFGFTDATPWVVSLALLSGVVFIVALLFYFWALYYGEASSAVVAMGALSPIATLIFSALLLGTMLQEFELVSFVLLVLGGLWLALLADKTARMRILFLVLGSAVLLGFSNVLAKGVFDATTFATGFVWMKIGGALFAALFLLHAPTRKKILHAEAKDEFKNKWGYFLNRGYAGVGSVLVLFAISLGPAPLVDAMQSARFLIIFLGGWLLLHERFSGKILWGKIGAFVLVSLGIIILGAGDYLERTKPDPARPILWGVTFSQKFSQKFDFSPLGRPVSKLVWQDNYDAILDDLEARHLRLIAYWDLIEPAEGAYDFSGLDYQMRRAEEVGADVILVVGKKVPRWPECHEPEWAQVQSARFKVQGLLQYVQVVVERYKDSPALKYWQVENEPFLPFGEGECALSGKMLLEAEMALVKSLDPHHPILVTDSGEIGPWFRAAKHGDIFGTTMYRRVHNDTLGNFEYPLPPWFFRLKEKIVRFIIQDYEKKFLVIELGLEPWLKRQPYETTPEEQQQVFDFPFFVDSLRYAKETGFDEYYLWGAEWWYWMNVKHNDQRFWDEARKLFSESH